VNQEQKLETGLWEFLVDNRYINGTTTMLIDLDRCTRCDDCVTACANAHNGNPRFVRNGKRFGKFLVAHACMHCIDPVCMIGCPTGAIRRNSYEGQVVITCANSCPYGNIQMVQIRDKYGAFVIDRATNVSVEKATKCDLCIDQIGGPACIRACSHNALTRIDIRNDDALFEWTHQ
jgi:Fe-S-cluster-containing dehydrogenase component